MKTLASIFSWVFLPLFTPIYALLIVFYLPSTPSSFLLADSLYHYPEAIKILFLSLFLVFIVFAPGLSLVVLKANKSISSLELENQDERPKPIAIMIFYSSVLYLFLILQTESNFIPNSIKAMALGGIIISVVAYFVNKILKISLHAMGLGALLGFVFSYYMSAETFFLWPIFLIISISAITLSGRLILKAHNLREIAYGYFLGFIIQVLTIYFYG